MATLMQINAITASTDLRNRTTAALTAKALLVRAEDESGMSDARKAKRQALAVAIALNVEQFVIPAVRLMGANVTVQGNCTFSGSGIDIAANTTAVPDGDITFVISEGYDLIAGVLPTEIP